MSSSSSSRSPNFSWRHILLLVSVLGPLALLFSRPLIAQPQEYYNFADQRAFFGIPIFVHLQGWFSGHSIKHLLAALGCLALLLMLKRRTVRETGPKQDDVAR